MKRNKYSPEFRGELVKLVLATSRPIAEVAREHNVKEGTLGNWVIKYRIEHAGEEPDLDINERARLRELERTNSELKMENEFLKKPAVYFAQTLQGRVARGNLTPGLPQIRT